MPTLPPLPVEDIIRFLKDYVEPVPDTHYGDTYRAAVYLTDGTYIPCVNFRNSQQITELAIKRFREKRGLGIAKNPQYEGIVRHFVTSGNKISYYEISKIEISPFAFPLAILKKIHGETTMGWTGFVIRMNDNRLFNFGSRFKMSFFEMPDGYGFENITQVINHSYVTHDGQLSRYTLKDGPIIAGDNIYREKVNFECFIDGL